MNKLRTNKKILLIFSIFMFMYLLSFGPFVALSAWKGWNEDHPCKIIIGIIFFPHILLAVKSDIYNRYVTWWMSLGDKKQAESFRRLFEKNLLKLKFN